MNRSHAVIAAAAGAGLIASLSAQAASVSFGDTIATKKTTWSDSLSVSKFDPSLGTLTGVSWTFGGNVAGNAQAESLDAAPAVLSLDLKATITVQKPGGGQLAQVIPVVNNTYNASAFDGTIDFGGTSGVSFLGLTGSGSDSGSVPSSDWADWTGIGNVTLATDAVGASAGTGAGNLITLFNTDAGADFRVTYSYDPAVVPEPGTLAMSGVVLLGAFGVWRRRRSQKA